MKLIKESQETYFWLNICCSKGTLHIHYHPQLFSKSVANISKMYKLMKNL